MPALNYQERFAGKVESGEKRQTIRPKRKREIKPGDTLHHYTGMRTRHCRKLLVSKCRAVREIRIGWFEINIYGEYQDLHFRNESMCMPGHTSSDYLPLEDFAKQDGFDSWGEMREWFQKRYGLPFDGVLIEW